MVIADSSLVGYHMHAAETMNIVSKNIEKTVKYVWEKFVPKGPLGSLQFGELHRQALREVEKCVGSELLDHKRCVAVEMRGHELLDVEVTCLADECELRLMGWAKGCALRQGVLVEMAWEKLLPDKSGMTEHPIDAEVVGKVRNHVIR